MDIPIRGDSMGITGGGLNDLPAELLCNIFRLTIHGEDTKEYRCRLMLVCRQWQEYVEGSACLWTDIDAHGSPIYVRRVLERSKGAMLDLYCWLFGRPVVELEALMAEAGPHIARWRSLVVGSVSLPALGNRLAPLTTTEAPSLEILKLFVGSEDYSISRDAIALFGGAPAPSTLKELALELTPVAIEPLKLSGLVSLHLTHVPTITTPQLLEILRRSPSLETLGLEGNAGLVAIGSQASNIPPIELPKLDSLSLGSMDYDGAKCILSNIRIRNRRSVLIRGDTDWAHARSVFFTSAITHLLHTTILNADVPSSTISVRGGLGGIFQIEFRGIDIELFTDANDRVREILQWMVDGLESEAAECLVHLILDWSVEQFIFLDTIPPPLTVKHLSISDSMDESLREDIYIAMAQPPDRTSPGWLHPQLESLSVEFESTESQKRLLSMLKNRYEGASVPGGTEWRCPASLRSVELRGSPRTAGLVEEIKGILGETNVFWAKEETP